MLMLRRKLGDPRVTGSDVRLAALGVWGNRVWIGVDGPRDMAVHREEVLERIQDHAAPELVNE